MNLIQQLPQNEISTNIPFKYVTNIFESILTSVGPKKKAEQLTKCFKSLKQRQSEYKQQHTNENNSSLFPILRLLIPDCDTDRSTYGIKSNTMGRLLIRALAISADSEEGKQLMRKTEDMAGGGNHHGYRGRQKYSDYADTVYEVMKNRSNPDGKLTVYEVNKHLDQIADCYKNNNRKKIEDELIYLIDGLTALDLKWLCRIIFSRIKLGLSSNKFLQLFHPAATDLYSKYSSLEKVCEFIDSMPEDGSSDGNIDGQILPKIVTLDHEPDTVEPGYKFHPMLCKSFSKIPNLKELITETEFYVETKMDGERFMLHIKNHKEYSYFTRHLNDYSHIFGGNIDEGTLTPQLSKLFKISIDTLILDGEMMVWNRDEHVYHGKAENTDVKAIKPFNSTLRPSYCVFDILYLNGVCLTKKPYAERIRLLKTILKEQIGVLTLCKPVKIENGDHILKCLNDAFDNGEEGVVIKPADSHYKLNTRNGGWYKIKPDYINGVISDFDLIILGGYWGSNNKSYLKTFLVGVFDKIPDKCEGKFLSVTTISSGLSYAQKCNINEQLKPHWNQCNHLKEGRTKKPQILQDIDFGGFMPDIWIKPENSIILEIRGSELVKSQSSATEYTIRFPRVQAVRTDKLWYDCCTLEEFQEFCGENAKVQKIHKRHMTDSDIDGFNVGNKKKAKSNSNSSNELIPKEITPIHVDKLDDICGDREFCILNVPKSNKPSVEQIKQMILKHGGRVVINPSAQKTFVCIAASSDVLRVKQMIKTKLYNIVKIDWLLRAMDGNDVRTELLPFHPNDMFCSTEQLDIEFQQKFDKFGDSYADSCSLEQFQTILNGISKQDIKKFSRMEIYEFERELYAPKKSDMFYRLATGYFYTKNKAPLNISLNLAKMLFKSKGGVCIDRIGNDDETHSVQISHIFVDQKEFTMEDFHMDHDYLDDTVDWSAAKFITFEWIIDCCQEQRKIKDTKYLIT